MRALRKGEYDLVNISLIGFDPVTGRSFEECHDEWDAARKAFLADYAACPWWNVPRLIRLRWQGFVLHQRHGALGL